MDFIITLIVYFSVACEFTQREADKLQRVLQNRTLPYLTAKDNLRVCN
jgi:hypothetical protein